MTIVNMVGGGGEEEVTLIPLPIYIPIYTSASYISYSGYTSYVYATTGLAICTGSKTTVRYNTNRYYVPSSNPYAYNASADDIMTSIARWLSNAGAPAGQYTIEVSYFSASDSGAFRTITFSFDGTNVTTHNLGTNMIVPSVPPLLKPSSNNKGAIGVVALSYLS